MADETVSGMDSMIDYLDGKLETATYHHKIRYEGDKAILYRMLGYISTSLGIFEDMEEYATGNDLDEVEKYVCRLQKEVDYFINEEISITDLIDGWDECESSSERNSYPDSQTEKVIKLREATIKAYPNPTTGNLIIELFPWF